MDKENKVLFYLAEKNLPEEKQTKLWEGFETIETHKIYRGSMKLFIT